MATTTPRWSVVLCPHRPGTVRPGELHDEVSEAVSVVMASYNGDRTLPATLAALERQRYRNFEVMVVDDGSTTPLEPVVRSAGLTVPVTVVRSPTNRGEVRRATRACSARAAAPWSSWTTTCASRTR
jgi:cellulose synthase/poly-beta-1,6-N-acetylglucosamine synthase-like glycosyltransferase